MAKTCIGIFLSGSEGADAPVLRAARRHQKSYHEDGIGVYRQPFNKRAEGARAHYGLARLPAIVITDGPPIRSRPRYIALDRTVLETAYNGVDGLPAFLRDLRDFVGDGRLLFRPSAEALRELIDFLHVDWDAYHDSIIVAGV